MIGYLYKFIKLLVLIFHKISEDVKTFKDKGDNKCNKLMYLLIDDKRL